MFTNKMIVNIRVVGGDYFRLQFLRSSNKKLSDFLTLFNFNDYYCFKSTRKQRQVTYEELLEFKYSSYLFFKKSLYDINHINKWIEFSRSTRGFMFLIKPYPPFDPYKKIIIKNA